MRTVFGIILAAQFVVAAPAIGAGSGLGQTLGGWGAEAPGPAANESEQIPPIVTSAWGPLSAECKRQGGVARLAPRFLSVADINRDGHSDYIIDFAQFSCDGGVVSGCGSGGCGLDIYMGRGNNTARRIASYLTSRVEIFAYDGFAIVYTAGREGENLQKITNKSAVAIRKVPGRGENVFTRKEV